MDSYNVIVTAEASTQLNHYTDYIYYILQNETATRNVYRDALQTQETLAYVAESLQYCEDAVLRNFGYRLIRFRRHQYLMMYRVEGSNVYIEAIYHQSQNYVNSFIHKMK